MLPAPRASFGSFTVERACSRLMSPCIAARRDADGYCTSSCSPLSNADVAIAFAYEFESAAFAIYGRATRTEKNTARSNARCPDPHALIMTNATVGSGQLKSRSCRPQLPPADR